MRYIIMQLPASHEARFYHYDWAKKSGCFPKKEDYVLVYQGQMWGDTSNIEEKLESIFARLNLDDRPYDYRVFSPSVSDVIGVEVGNCEWDFYYIDGVGFKKIWDKKNS